MLAFTRVQVVTEPARAIVARVVPRLDARSAGRDLVAGPEHLLDTALLHGLWVRIISRRIALHALTDIVQFALVTLTASIARSAREGDVLVDHLGALVAEELAYVLRVADDSLLVGVLCQILELLLLTDDVVHYVALLVLLQHLTRG